VLPSRKGLTVEIGNTDAEGRLILADALALADEERPDLLISMATLTGSARVAVGPDLAPFYCDDDAVAQALAAGEATLTVVSALEPDTYVSRVDAARVEATRARLATTAGVTHHERLPARAVREVMAEHHLLLFPTLDETFGYVLPEAFATGLDVVTTATRAIPEIVAPDDRVRLITLPVDALGGWTGVRAWRTAGDAAFNAAWADARERCVEGIRARLAEIRATPGALAARAGALRARYEAVFSPEALGARLTSLYARVAARPLGRS